MKANIGPLEFSFSRLSKRELRSLMDSSSRSLDEESNSSNDDERWTTSSQVTQKAGNSLTRQLLHPFTECGNLNETLPSTPLIALSPKSNRMPALYMETESKAEDAPVIPFASYKPTPKISNVSYEWNSPRNRARSADPSQTESPLFFGRAFFQPDGENERSTLLSPEGNDTSYGSSSSSSPVHIDKKAKLMATIQKLKSRQRGKKRLLSLALSGSSSYSEYIGSSSSSSSEDGAQVGLLQRKDDDGSFERQLAFDVEVLEPDDELSMKWQMIMDDSSSCWDREYQPFQKHVIPHEQQQDDHHEQDDDDDDDDTEPAYSTSMVVSDFNRRSSGFSFQRAKDLQTNLSTVDEMSLEQQSSVSTARTRSSTRSLRHILLDVQEI